MKILVVDDSQAMRKILVRTLRMAGFGAHSIAEASDGARALSSIAAEQPDVVLSDWNMPELNGIELLQRLRADGNEVRFGFVTSQADPEMKQIANDAGAMFFITKPFTVDSFQQTLGPVLV